MLKSGKTEACPQWSAFPQTVAFLRDVHMDSLFFPLFDSLHDVCFFLKNRSGEILLCNRQLLSRFDMKSERSILGKTDFDLHPRKLAIKYQSDDSYVINSGKPLLKIVEIFRRETGVLGWYMTDKYPVFNKNGEVAGVMGITRRFHSNDGGSFANGKLGLALEWMEQHFLEDFDIRSMAEASKQSVRMLERVFREQIGITPKQYALRMRILHACAELRDSRKTVRDIAAQCGFYDQSAFSRMFKQIMGITPQVYRNLYL